MSQNFVKLASQGRAYDGTRAWTEDELTAWFTLQTECGLGAREAAEYVRNGIKTVADYSTAKEAQFVPKSFETLRADAISSHVGEVRAQLGLDEPLLDAVSEPEVVPEPEAPVVEVVGEPEVVPEPEKVVEVKKASKK